jgi:hypothetical protein
MEDQMKGAKKYWSNRLIVQDFLFGPPATQNALDYLFSPHLHMNDLFPPYCAAMQ